MENHILTGLLKSRTQVRWGAKRPEKTWCTTRTVDYCWSEQQKQRCVWKTAKGRRTMPYPRKSSECSASIERTHCHLHSESQSWNTCSGRLGITLDMIEVSSHQSTDGIYSAYIGRTGSFALMILHTIPVFQSHPSIKIPVFQSHLFRCASKLY